jgi:hypothetical protein
LWKRLSKTVPEYLNGRRAHAWIIIVQKLAAELAGGVQGQPGNGAGRNFRRFQLPALLELPVIGNLFGRS